MSHSVCLVIGPKRSEVVDVYGWLAEALAPFDESLTVEPYFVALDDSYRKYAVETLGATEGDLNSILDALNGNDPAEDDEKYLIKDGVIGRMSTYNPRSRWDWYSVGGRWQGFLIAKPGTAYRLGQASWASDPEDQPHPRAADVICKGDIDWDAMTSARAERAREMWDRFQGDPALDYVTEEEFLRRRSAVSTFAVLKDGEWYEKGHMGWWGVVNDEKDQRDWDEEWGKLVNSVDDDTLLIVVDVHI